MIDFPNISELIDPVFICKYPSLFFLELLFNLDIFSSLFISIFYGLFKSFKLELIYKLISFKLI
jgi:hypothetical protein